MAMKPTQPLPVQKLCRACVHFEKLADMPAGRCRRNSPRPYVVPHGHSEHDLTLDAYWPFTSEGDWCGDFAEKK